MTNGEKLVKVFPDIELYKKMHSGIQIDFDSVWWNAEYKEPTIKSDITENCIACKYDEDDDKSERCKKCLAGDSQFELDDAPTESTTKSDLGVDCISRADAIKVASGYCHPSNVAAELAKLPSVTPQEPRWISVSERLPKDSGEYFVTVIDEDVETYKHTGIAWYAHPKDYDVEEGDWRELMIDEKVIAWMPLPTPYEPQEVRDKE